MATYDSLESLTGAMCEAVVHLLYRLADDELIIGHRNSEWAASTSIPDEYAAFSSMARDEIDHARAYYEMLHQLGEPDCDTLILTRSSRQFRCASLVCLPNNQDWVFSILRQFLYDTAKMVRLTALCDGTLTPLARLAMELQQQERGHLTHSRRWVLGLCRSMEENRGKLQAVLHFMYPHALGLFEPTEADVPLAQAGICLPEDELCRHWESAVAPVLADAGLDVPETVQPIFGGRVGRHPQALTELLISLQRADHSNPSPRH